MSRRIILDFVSELLSYGNFYSTMTNLSITKASSTLIIGVTGYRNLLEKDWSVKLGEDGKHKPEGYLLDFVETKLLAIRRDNSDKNLVLLSGMAEGADLLVAHLSHHLQIPLITVLAENQERFLASFKPEPDRALCRQLLNAAQQKVVCTPEVGMTIYQEVGRTIARYADELIELWNGTDTGSAGRTWEVIHMGLTGKDAVGNRIKLFQQGRKTTFQLHHLLPPRQEYPYPVARYFGFTALQSVLPLGVAYSLNILVNEQNRVGCEPFRWIWTKLVEYRKFVLKNLLPTVFFLFSIIWKTWGLMEYQDYLHDHPNVILDPAYHHFTLWEAFYKALKLEAIFLPAYDVQVSEYFDKYVAGKLAGMLFFLLAFFSAVVKFFDDRPRRWLVWLLGWWPGRFYLVLGLNERSHAALTSLREEHRWVTVLDPNHNAHYYESSQKKGAIVINDNPAEPFSLPNINFSQAKEVFLLGDGDNDNIHLVQHMDQLLVKGTPLRRWLTRLGWSKPRSDWYVQIQDADKRQFLNRFTHKLDKVHLYAFNLHANMARRLLLQYSIDRFYQNPHADSTDVFVFGFEELGRQVVLNCLKLAHFEPERKLNIHILTANPTQEETSFLKQYPFLVSTHKNLPEDADSNILLAKEVFGHVHIAFHEIPRTDFALLKDDFVLYESIKSNRIVNVYYCLPDELYAAAQLSSLLQRLNSLQQQQVKTVVHPVDIQIFCYYRFPNQEDSFLVEKRFNELAKYIPVVCLGEVQQECSVQALRDRALDKIAQLAAIYHGHSWSLQDAKAILRRADEAWAGLSAIDREPDKNKESDKEANRLFADHAFVKMRQVWSWIPANARPAIEDATLTVARQLNESIATDKAFETSMANLEHRRWCAEKLLDGWVPLETDPEKIAASATHWNNDKPFKTLARAQKRQLNLVPVAMLPKLELKKDLQLIQGLPIFVEILQTKTEKSSRLRLLLKRLTS